MVLLSLYSSVSDVDASGVQENGSADNCLTSCLYNDSSGNVRLSTDAFFVTSADLVSNTYCIERNVWEVIRQIDGLQHKGIMSTKPVFHKIAQTQRSYVPSCGHTTFVLLTPAPTMTIMTKSRYFAMM